MSREQAMDAAAEKYRKDPRLSEDLLREVETKDIDDHDTWDLIAILQQRIEQVFPMVKAMLFKPKTNARIVAAPILGQNGVYRKAKGPECVAALTEALKANSDPEILSSILSALSCLHYFGTRDLVLPYADHPSGEVRFWVAMGIGRYSDEVAVQTQIRLSRDQNFDTRNWATFGLGSLLDLDTEEIRKALADRLDEEDAELRSEAVVGLARRSDSRVIKALMKEMDQDRHSQVLHNSASIILERQAELGLEWQPLLARLQEGDYSKK